jgi:FtsP/CotA-like multicopper oxidase with cupredoxin domain
MATRPLSIFSRRSVLQGVGAVLGAGVLGTGHARAAAPLLTVGTRTLDVKGKAATVFGIRNPTGGMGVLAREGERFSGSVLNDTRDPLVMHWHGQIHAPYDQDRARPDGGALAVGASDTHDFLLTPGTHWMHSHQLTEQQLLAAPMVTREADAGDVQDVVVMLHDFAFRSPAEILAELGGTEAHGGHAGHGAGAAAAPAADPHAGHMGHGAHGGGHGGHGAQSGGHGGHSMTMIHANDVRYDAYLANDRTFDDPEIVRVERRGRVRVRFINGATATAFILDVGALKASCVAVDGTPCQPAVGQRFPLAQGQRIDLVVDMPAEGGAFPLVAQVEDSLERTGLILATPGATVAKVMNTADAKAPFADFGFERMLRAKTPLSKRAADRTFELMLGEEPGYRFTINGKVHGEHTPLTAKVGERIEIAIMNPTMMMHPMHIHGHHFQVIGTQGGRFSGALRDTVIVPPHTPVLIALDLDKVGDWYLHCHHLYHMATGMMTELKVTG